MAVRPLEVAAHRAQSHAPVTARLYRRLLTDLVLGKLPPGSRLPLHALARRYDTSSATVRQALLQLAAEGLIDTDPALGFRAGAATADDLLDLTRTLSWLMGIGVRESIANGDGLWESGVLAAQRLFAQSIGGGGLARREDLPLAGERFLEWQDALVAACRSRNLLDFCRSLNRRLLRYRNLAGVHAAEERTWSERMRKAVLERNTALACETLDAYYRYLLERLFGSGLLGFAADSSAAHADRGAPVLKTGPKRA